MRIPQISPLVKSIPRGCTAEQNASFHTLPEELIRQRHDVSPFPAVQSTTSARLIAC